MVIGIIKTIGTIGNSIISIITKNKFLATIFLILILFLVGNAISSMFTAGYKCLWSESTGNTTMLVDMTLYEDCILPFTRGSLQKYKLNTSACIDYASANNKDQEWNDTCQEIALYQSRLQSGLEFERIIDQTIGWIFEMAGRWFHEVNGSELVDIWVEPNYCPDLYNCLKSNTDATSALLLTPGCTMSDFPTTEEYENVTIIQYPDGYKLAGIFYIDCIAKDQYNWKPQITIFGIDFLNWKLWIFMIILVNIAIAYRKWGSMLKL